MAGEPDKLLPIANVGRIMKQALPPNAKISKEARERIQECATEFIGFVTGEASDRCHRENRRTMNGDDICWAFKSLGLDNYSETMFMYLYKLRRFQMQKQAQGRGKGKASCSNKEDDVPTSNVGGIDPPSDTSNQYIDFGILKRGGM